ncbi:MAG TPA: GNAT family N-acetyltransferase [Steroidobacteraceae bacterium]|nr:GNAT family N-acetyltransferase [Steroidobacteraceae bacterium]
MTLDLQPTLVGPQLALRPLAQDDFEELAAAAADPLIWALHPDPGRATRAGFERYFADALLSQACLVAVDTAHDVPVGCSRYTQYVPGASISIGYTFLARSHWGGATNAEMKRLMLHHAFSDVQEVLFMVAEHNLRSRRAVEKLGALPRGVEDSPRWGQIHVIYGLTPRRWAQAAAPGYGP